MKVIIIISFYYLIYVFNFLVVPLLPMDPSPCGLYAECKVVNNQAACTCLKNYIGIPSNCRAECVVQIVHRIKLVSRKNVAILALAPAVRMLIIEYRITYQFACVNLDIPAVLSPYAR